MSRNEIARPDVWHSASRLRTKEFLQSEETLKLRAPGEKMNRLLFMLSLSFITFHPSGLMLGQENKCDQYQMLVGTWTGVVNAGGMKFTLVFKFREDEKKTVRGTMDILEQDAKDLPIQDIVLRGDSLILDLSSIMRKYAGRVMDDRKVIEGNYIRYGTIALPLTLQKVDSEVVLNRPQTPRPPYPYKEESATFQNVKEGVTLAGTLDLPKDNDSAPALVFISGSGAQDRDETAFGHKPFLVLADYLARRGIASLRFDDRGVGGSSGDHFQSTTKRNAEDVLSAIRYLKSRKEIDGRNMGLLGHSEGCVIATIAASKFPELRFIVALGAPGVSIEENLYLQNTLIRKAEGASDVQIEQYGALQKKIFSEIKESKNDSLTTEKLRALYSFGRYQALPQNQKQAIDARIRDVLTPYFRDILSYDPRPDLLKVKVPFLALTGEKDLQAPPDPNLRALEEALKDGGNTQVTIMKMPGLNHMLQVCRTGSMAEYSTIEETIAPAVLEAIHQWIVDHLQ
jgi:pimeloyl-ACP methyl ester carboxylesterase